ncbi:MAG: murein biosynthesis integral membrane protein MurJ [Candidatus Omnitrophica bacterium]|nr:murein biosynthesis integral membrane protein MurJ [Candidatus Omnitrophota bacterium]
MSPTQTNQKILQSTSVMSLGTMLSRILGFVRDIIFAKFFGTALGADAFVVAFRIPNLFRDIIGEGAANSSFVPVMTEYKENRPEELKEFLNAVFLWAVRVLVVITIIGVLCAPLIIRAIAPGLASAPERLELAANLTRIMFPYLIFIGLTALFSAIQFTFGSFTMPALGPCLLNIALIVSTLMAVWWMKQPVYGLAIGVVVGGLLQLWFQWRPLKKHGVVFRWPRTINHEGVKRVGKLLMPRILGTAVYQLNIFIDTICASLSSIVGPGAISAIYYANRLVFLPLGVFGVALAVASLPVFSRYALVDNKEEFKKTLVFSLQNIIFVMLPMTVFFCLLARPIIRVIFQRGAFDVYSTIITSDALFFFSLGLIGYGGVKILVTAFHALQDTKTPVKVAVMALVVNAALNGILMFPMKLSGIALASSISAFVNITVLAVLLEKRLGIFLPSLRGFLLKIIVPALGQGLVVWAFWRWLFPVPEILRLVIVFVLGSTVYWFIAHLCKFEQPKAIIESLFAKCMK